MTEKRNEIKNTADKPPVAIVTSALLYVGSIPKKECSSRKERGFVLRQSITHIVY